MECNREGFCEKHDGVHPHVLNVPVRVIKKKDDGICTRVSIGGSEETGVYCVYRGSLDDVKDCLLAVYRKLQMLEIEPAISPDDGKEFA